MSVCSPRLLRFTQDDDAARNKRFAVIADALADALRMAVQCRSGRVADAGHGGMPLVEIAIAAESNSPTASQVAARLRASTPSIHVDCTNADTGILMLVPTCLRIDDASVIGSAFAAAVSAGA